MSAVHALYSSAVIDFLPYGFAFPIFLYVNPAAHHFFHEILKGIGNRLTFLKFRLCAIDNGTVFHGERIISITALQGQEKGQMPVPEPNIPKNEIPCSEKCSHCF